jgi:VWA domain-containing protein
VHVGATIHEQRCLDLVRLSISLVFMLVFVSSATAGPTLFEYGPKVAPRPAEQLALGTCDVHVELDGAIAEVAMHQQIRNGGTAPLGAAYELELPAAARVIGLDFGGAAVGVSAQHEVALIDDPNILGPDPAVMRQLGAPVHGRTRYRVLAQPLEPGQVATMTLRWTAVAAIAGSALHVTLPGGEPCAATLHATPGPGATVRALQPGAKFSIAADDVVVGADLELAGHDPIAWLQTSPLGNGFTAQALTVIAPPLRAPPVAAPRVVLLIDTSRSMELVGRDRVRALVHAIGTALPAHAQLQAVAFGRTATRLLDSWQEPTAAVLAALDGALAHHGVDGGSDPALAFAAAHELLGTADHGLVVAITDAAFVDVADDALVAALASRPADVDVHAIAISPVHMRPPSTVALRAAVTHYGGSYDEVGADELDAMLGSAASWLRPAWVDLAARGVTKLPYELRAGDGTVVTSIAHAHAAPIVITARSESQLAVTAHLGPQAPVAALALAVATADDFGQGAAAEAAHERALLHDPAVDELTDLAVLARSGRVAKSRHEMIAGGGTYTRSIALADPAFEPVTYPGAGISAGSALDRDSIERLLQLQLQPRVFACYQHALPRAPKLAGTATFELQLGRGEVQRATLIGLGDAAFDACLLDTAYSLEPPMPTPGVNVDDRTIVHYPLTFTVNADKPYVFPGDADSTTPIDIDAVKGGVPHPPIHVDPSLPLSGLPSP